MRISDWSSDVCSSDLFYRLHDIAARGADLFALVVHRHGEFGRQHDVLAPGAQNLAHLDLGAALVAVGIGSVEQRNPEIERLVDHLARGFEIQTHLEIVAAKADFRHQQARGNERSEEPTSELQSL